MTTMKNVAIIGASGNFGTPITKALIAANFSVTIITRIESTTPHPPNIPTLRINYTFHALTNAFDNQDAVICVVGPGGIPFQKLFIEAAHAAGVERFIIDDFGWGPNPRSYPEFGEVHKSRKEGWDYAARLAEEDEGFSWTGLSTGNPIDWALKNFPMMGFNSSNRTSTIYDSGTESFTGTTLSGIGAAVVGVLLHPLETKNRFCTVMSIKTCQNELLDAFETATGEKWEVKRDSAERLRDSGQGKFARGEGGWVLELVVAQMFEVGGGICLVQGSFGESDSGMLGVKQESAGEIVGKVLEG